MRKATQRGTPEGSEGWDDYAPFYDWENARTLGRRDLPFWTHLATRAGGDVLELGCGTGRLSLPLGRAGVRLVGVDRSAAMLARASTRVARAGLGGRISLARADIRYLPFPDPAPSRRTRRKAGARDDRAVTGHRGFALVMAPYGMLQSLLRERDLTATLAEVHRVLQPGGTLGVELVADLPSWEEYDRRVSLKGWRSRPGGSYITLIETVRQDRRRRLTLFDQEFVERRGRLRQTHRFSLAFRTLSVPQMVSRLRNAGFEITALLGDYRGGPWDPRAEVWMIVARKP